MKENRLMSVNQIFTLESAKTMQGVILKKSPVPISAIFANRVRTTQTQTRSGSYFNPCNTTRVKCRQTLRYCGPMIWNDLPNHVKWKDIANPENNQPTPLDFTRFCTNLKNFIFSETPFI